MGFMTDLKQYMVIGQAIVDLMDPLVEVVIHDIETNKIVFIAGSLSGRKKEDESLLEDTIHQNEDDFVNKIYSKMNTNGQLIRSISIPIYHQTKLISLMCINFDISIFETMNALTTTILTKQLSRQPDTLFKNDWQEKINQFIHCKVRSDNKKIDSMSNKEKKEIVLTLFNNGAFTEKKAADFIAKILHMSRATIFNYLKVWRKSNAD